MKSKTIILSSSKKFANNSPRAILTLVSENNTLDGKIRLYNMQDLQRGVKLGIYYNNEVISSNLIKDRDAYNFKLNQHLDLDKDVYCALVDTLNKNDVILSGGNDLGFCFSDEVEGSDEEDIGEIADMEELNIDIDSDDSENYTYTKHDSNNNNDTSNCNNNCKDCVYKKYFFEHHAKCDLPNDYDECNQEKKYNCVEKPQNKFLNQENFNTDNKHHSTNREECKEDFEAKENCSCNLFENECFDFESFEKKQNDKTCKEQASTETKQPTTIETNIEPESVNTNITSKQSEAENFISIISEQLDELFATYPVDEEIMAIIPNSKIVRIVDPIDDSYYVVGVIYENDRIEYLIYGVPAKYNSPVPLELGENYQWLALNPDDPMSDGYYLIYQNASNGKLMPI